MSALPDMFNNLIRENHLLSHEEPVLLAVSGGIDSMVMTDLFLKSGYRFGIAHCNFQLRGQESDEDEDFVRTLAEKNEIPFYCKKFDTEKVARSNGISIQMAARDLRFEWFEKIRQQNSYHSIALAHNRDDSIETFLINMTRGTGIRGLSGMKARQDRIIRPLLFASRDELVDYSRKNGVKFRVDSSNLTTKYARNRIRHRIIPEFSEINPNFKNNMTETISNLSDVEKVFLQIVNRERKEIVTEHDEQILIDIHKLRNLEPAAIFLYEFLKPYNFPRQVVDNIHKSLDGTAGKQFFSQTHRLIKDRKHLIIEPLNKSESESYYIEEEVSGLDFPIHLSIKKVPMEDPVIFPSSSDTAFVDCDLLVFPLILRKWKNGDQFQPLGMKNMKKLSDFFIDNKVSLPEKESTWILTSDKKIVWIVGKRLDDRFKITENTTHILVLEVHRAEDL